MASGPGVSPWPSEAGVPSSALVIFIMVSHSHASPCVCQPCDADIWDTGVLRSGPRLPLEGKKSPGAGVAGATSSASERDYGNILGALRVNVLKAFLYQIAFIISNPPCMSVSQNGSLT